MRQQSQKRPRSQLTSPLLPRGVDIIVQPPSYDACTFVDKLLVYASSLIVIGSPLYFYFGIYWLYKKWKHYRALAKEGSSELVNDKDYTSSGESSQEKPSNIQQCTRYKKMAAKYGAALAMVLIISFWGPHRSKRVGEWLNARRWRLWDSWLNYVGFSVLHDRGDDDTTTQQHPEFDPQSSDAMYAFVPHGIFPFGLAFSCLPERGYNNTWGLFRPVVATATRLFPLVRTFIAWMSGVDASRSAVSSALSQPDHNNRRLGISPGGIAEMFESYPKPGYHPNDEAALLKGRNGLFKLAVQHNIPIVPVYTFGATKMFRRVQLPYVFELVSRALRISLCLLYGKLGLPIPFRQRLMYVVGKTLWPSTISGSDVNSLAGEQFDERVQQMHDAFCNEIIRIFDRNKTHYGWKDKTLRLV